MVKKIGDENLKEKEERAWHILTLFWIMVIFTLIVKDPTLEKIGLLSQTLLIIALILNIFQS